jgi:uncharacterized Zn-finger protein
MVREFKCSKCDKKYGLRRARRSHQDTCGDTPRFPCPSRSCDRKFRSPRIAEQHEADAHRRRFTCPDPSCYRTFLTAGTMVQHFNLEHRTDDEDRNTTREKSTKSNKTDSTRTEKKWIPTHTATRRDDVPSAAGFDRRSVIRTDCPPTTTSSLESPQPCQLEYSNSTGDEFTRIPQVPP